ncbi:lipopolysaccharide biosynthesis protein, partial [Anaerotruncus sp. X29]|nr:lipopolysaccharide biosynthesis protein [Anaerotruncus sp. X29]
MNVKSIFKSLAGNTLIFAIGNGVTLIIAFIMIPFYTKVLSPSDFGISDIIITTTSMLLPLVSLNIFAAIFRFALDKESNRETLFTNGLNVTLIGIAASIFVSGVLEAFGLSYALLVGFYLSATLLLNFFQNFVRGIEHVKAFALSGIIATVTNVSSNLLLMWVFKLGLNGYLFSLLISTLITVIFLAIVEKLHRYVKWTSKSWTETKALLKYSIPMIPNSFAWWLTNDANKIIIL